MINEYWLYLSIGINYFHPACKVALNIYLLRPSLQNYAVHHMF